MNKYLITGGSGFIGTNLIEYLLNKGENVLNIDINPPQNSNHTTYWVNCNINDKCSVIKNFKEFNPDYVIHLAARTDAKGKSLEDYETNIKGTSNILEVSKEVNSIRRVIITSSQFVHYRDKSFPVNDSDYSPFTLYGESKVLTEKLTKTSDLKCVWTIIRPTRVWGFWQQDRYSFYRMLYKGFYMHPGRKPVKRAFGYVGNVIYQIEKILEAPTVTVDKKVFYVGDEPINLVNWVEVFALKLNNKRVIFCPRLLMKVIAHLGDLLDSINVDFPFTSYRFTSLVTDDDAPMKRTFEIFGLPPFSMEGAIEETVKLIKLNYPEFRNQT